MEDTEQERRPFLADSNNARSDPQFPIYLATTGTSHDSKIVNKDAEDSDGLDLDVLSILSDRPKLLKRLRKIIHVTTFILRIGYVVAIVVLLGWGGVLSVFEALAGQAEVATGQAACAGGSLLVLRRRKRRAERVLKRADEFLSNPKLHEDLFDIAADALKAVSEQALDTLGLFGLALIAPSVLAIPSKIIRTARIQSVVNKVLVYFSITVIGAVMAGLVLLLYDELDRIVMKKIDQLVKRIDEMPQFDWVDKPNDVHHDDDSIHAESTAVSSASTYGDVESGSGSSSSSDSSSSDSSSSDSSSSDEELTIVNLPMETDIRPTGATVPSTESTAGSSYDAIAKKDPDNSKTSLT